MLTSNSRWLALAHILQIELTVSNFLLTALHENAINFVLIDGCHFSNVSWDRSIIHIIHEALMNCQRLMYGQQQNITYVPILNLSLRSFILDRALLMSNAKSNDFPSFCLIFFLIDYCKLSHRQTCTYNGNSNEDDQFIHLGGQS